MQSRSDAIALGALGCRADGPAQLEDLDSGCFDGLATLCCGGLSVAKA